jgi:hypothetical protein
MTHRWQDNAINHWPGLFGIKHTGHSENIQATSSISRHISTGIDPSMNNRGRRASYVRGQGLRRGYSIYYEDDFHVR